MHTCLSTHTYELTHAHAFSHAPQMTQAVSLGCPWEEADGEMRESHASELG